MRRCSPGSGSGLRGRVPAGFGRPSRPPVRRAQRIRAGVDRDLWQDATVDGPHLICEGPPVAEGPVWCPGRAEGDEGTLAFTSVAGGVLSRVTPSTGHVEQVADTGGGPNGAVAAADGGFVVTQNGGLDFTVFEMFDPVPPPPRYVPSGLQHVDARRLRVVPHLRCHAATERPLRRGRRHHLLHRPAGLPAARPAGRARARARPDGRAAGGGRRLLVRGTASGSISTARPSSSWRTASRGATRRSCGSGPTARANCSPTADTATGSRSTSTGGSTWRGAGTS